MKKETKHLCIKRNIASLVEIAFRVNENYAFENRLNELTGIRTTIYFLYSDKHELYKFVSNAIDSIIARDYELFTGKEFN